MNLSYLKTYVSTFITCFYHCLFKSYDIEHPYVSVSTLKGTLWKKAFCTTMLHDLTMFPGHFMFPGVQTLRKIAFPKYVLLVERNLLSSRLFRVGTRTIAGNVIQAAVPHTDRVCLTTAPLRALQAG